MNIKKIKIKDLITAWIEKYILRVASPSCMPHGYKYRFDYLDYHIRGKHERNIF